MTESRNLNLAETVALRVASLMALDCVNRTQLAKSSGVTSTELQHLLDPSVKHSATIHTVERVAKAFNTTADALLRTNGIAAIVNEISERKANQKPVATESDQPASYNVLKEAFKSVGNALKSVAVPAVPALPATVPAVAFPETEVVMVFPVKGGKEWAFGGDALLEMKSAYPGLDLLRELREARAWCIANPAQQKTARGMMKFLNSWFSRASRTQTPKIAATEAKPAEPTKYGFFDIDGNKTPYKPKETASVSEPDFSDSEFSPDTGDELPQAVEAEPFSDDEPVPADDGFQTDGVDF